MCVFRSFYFDSPLSKCQSSIIPYFLTDPDRCVDAQKQDAFFVGCSYSHLSGSTHILSISILFLAYNLSQENKFLFHRDATLNCCFLPITPPLSITP